MFGRVFMQSNDSVSTDLRDQHFVYRRRGSGEQTADIAQVVFNEDHDGYCIEITNRKANTIKNVRNFSEMADLADVNIVEEVPSALSVGGKLQVRDQNGEPIFVKFQTPVIKIEEIGKSNDKESVPLSTILRARQVPDEPFSVHILPNNNSYLVGSESGVFTFMSDAFGKSTRHFLATRFLRSYDHAEVCIPFGIINHTVALNAILEIIDMVCLRKDQFALQEAEYVELAGQLFCPVINYVDTQFVQNSCSFDATVSHLAYHVDEPEPASAAQDEFIIELRPVYSEKIASALQDRTIGICFNCAKLTKKTKNCRRCHKCACFFCCGQKCVDESFSTHNALCKYMHANFPRKHENKIVYKDGDSNNIAANNVQKFSRLRDIACDAFYPDHSLVFLLSNFFGPYAKTTIACQILMKFLTRGCPFVNAESSYVGSLFYDNADAQTYLINTKKKRSLFHNYNVAHSKTPVVRQQILADIRFYFFPIQFEVEGAVGTAPSFWANFTKKKLKDIGFTYRCYEGIPGVLVASPTDKSAFSLFQALSKEIIRLAYQSGDILHLHVKFSKKKLSFFSYLMDKNFRVHEILPARQISYHKSKSATDAPTQYAKKLLKLFEEKTDAANGKGSLEFSFLETSQSKQKRHFISYMKRVSNRLQKYFCAVRNDVRMHGVNYTSGREYDFACNLTSQETNFMLSNSAEFVRLFASFPYFELIDAYMQDLKKFSASCNATKASDANEGKSCAIVDQDFNLKKHNWLRMQTQILDTYHKAATLITTQYAGVVVDVEKLRRQNLSLRRVSLKNENSLAQFATDKEQLKRAKLACETLRQQMTDMNLLLKRERKEHRTLFKLEKQRRRALGMSFNKIKKEHELLKASKKKKIVRIVKNRIDLDKFVPKCEVERLKAEQAQEKLATEKQIFKLRSAISTLNVKVGRLKECKKELILQNEIGQDLLHGAYKKQKSLLAQLKTENFCARVELSLAKFNEPFARSVQK